MKLICQKRFYENLKDVVIYSILFRPAIIEIIVRSVREYPIKEHLEAQLDVM